MRNIEQGPDDMFHHDDGQTVALKLPEEVERRRRFSRGQPGHELVEQQKFWRGREGARQFEALAIHHVKRIGETIRRAAQANRTQQLAGFFASLGSRKPVFAIPETNKNVFLSR